jgi:hypothetical protein
VSDEVAVEIYQIHKMAASLSRYKSVIFKCLNELKQFIYKSQREPFQSLETLQKEVKNVWPVVSQDSIRSAIDQWKSHNPQERGSCLTLIPIKM